MTAAQEAPTACKCGEQIAEALREVLKLVRQHPAPPPPLTINQAAERLNVDRDALARWVREGKVPYTRIAGGRSSIRFTERHIADIIAVGEHRIEPPAAGRAESGRMSDAMEVARQHNIALLARRNRQW